MFTGIVTDIGTIQKTEERGDLHARISCSYDVDAVDLGASIACDGVCLTVVAKGDVWFEVDISTETVSKTNLDTWQSGKRINLERALKLGDELGGHIVSGHVDGLATIIKMQGEGDSTRVTLTAPDHLSKFIAQKGSVTLNGASLTVNDVNGSEFDINFIPHTKTHTTWGEAKVGDRVNLEIDTMARYVARLQEWDN